MKQLRLVCFFICLMTSSCTLYRFGLRYLDWITARELTSLFDLTKEQSTSVKAMVNRNLTWLRREWTPQVIGVMRQLSARSPERLTETDVKWFLGELVQKRTALVTRFSIDLADLAKQLTEEQIRHAEVKFAKKNENLEELLKASDEKLTNKRRSKLAESTSDWYGNISGAEQVEVCKIFGCSRQDVERRLRFTRAYQQILLKHLREMRQSPKFAYFLIQWSQTPELFLTEPVRSEWLAHQAGAAARFMALDTLLPERQRQKARKRFREIEADLKWFSEQP